MAEEPAAKAETEIEVPAHFDDVVAEISANREAEPLLVKQATANENFVEAGVKTADVLLKMAGVMNTLLDNCAPFENRLKDFSTLRFSWGKLYFWNDYPSFNIPKVRILPKKGSVLIWYNDTANDFPDFNREGLNCLSRLFSIWITKEAEPKPAFERLEEVYNKRWTLEGKQAILDFYSKFLSLPSHVYAWMESIKAKQEERYARIASHSQAQAEVIGSSLERLGDLEQKLKVLVPDPVAERIAQLESQ